ncbi:GyrI-like domain-containing protein [Rapidithrix thailandica]|uniref:GyrI-like domain-containing protein n=1 Tax=Rapidithrix thailandica TaxID=413964 RepID=A0AAW9S0J5_9BACT
MEKTDLKKLFKNYYNASTQPELVSFGKAEFLSITGKGDPSSSSFKNSIQALYSVAYGIKFHYKSQGKDFVVAKLEGLWWFDNKRFGQPSMREAPLKVPRDEWQWRLLIRIPEYVEESQIQLCKEKVMQKKGLPLTDAVEYFEMGKGQFVQVLHQGPFDKEPESLAKLEAFMTQKRLKKAGLHHEIYLSDFTKTAPEKLKTILREPVYSM